MRPLAEIEPLSLGRLKGVLFDIDDTLTSDGRLTAEAYAAMERLKEAGLLLAPITGRPAGWCDHIARMWPVDAVVGENGAFYFSYDHARRHLTQRFALDESTRRSNRARLDALAADIVRQVPGAALASDQPYRVADIAIDYCEDVARLKTEAVGRIVALMEAAGLQAKVSSIHVNGWFGSYDKLTMARRMLREVAAIDIETERQRFAFLGDSPNDAPMFEFFPLSVGVANVRDFADRLKPPPAFVTEAPSGRGFAEFARAVLAARSIGA